MKTLQLPLFPLHTVLFPGGPLPLRIFEARYIDMVSECLKRNTGFGVCMIRSGREVGEAANPYEVGTVAHIVDWHMRHDGLLGISAIGESRFRLDSIEVMPNRLSVAKVELLADDPQIALPDEFLPLVDILRRIMEHAGHHYADIPTHFGDASWVSFRLAELLPIKMAIKQEFLELDDPISRLIRIVEILKSLEIH